MQKKQGSKELIFLQNRPSDSEEEAMHGGLNDLPREVTCTAISRSLNQLHCRGTFTKEGYCIEDVAGARVIIDTLTVLLPCRVSQKNIRHVECRVVPRDILRAEMYDLTL